MATSYDWTVIEATKAETTRVGTCGPDVNFPRFHICRLLWSHMVINYQCTGGKCQVKMIQSKCLTLLLPTMSIIAVKGSKKSYYFKRA